MILKLLFLALMAAITAYSLWKNNPRHTLLRLVIPVFVLFPVWYSVVILNSMPKMTFFMLATLLVLVVALYEYDYRFELDWIDFTIFGIAFWAAVAHLVNDSFGSALLVFMNGVVDNFVPYILVRILIPKETVLRMLFAVAVAVSVMALLAPVEFFANLKLPDLFQKVWPEWVSNFPFVRGGFYRVYSTFGHPIYAGMMFSLALIIAFLVIRLKIFRSNWLPWLMIVVNSLAIYMTVSRTSYFVTPPIVAMLFFVFSKRRALYGGLMLVGLALVLFVAVPALNRYSTQLGEDADETQTSAAYRAVLWDNYLPVVQGRPLFGHGFWLPVVAGQPSIDNYYLFLLLMGGFPALTFFALPFVLLIFRGLFRFFQTPSLSDQVMIWAILCCFTYYGVVLGTVWIGGQPQNFLYMLAACLVNVIRGHPAPRPVPMTIRRWL